ncbi:nadh pyrophosphatase [hydrocarbon metagenome]|uniref:NAD(+) diphosphatase n=1 Tax=hydrocarbon metagenome TaxID=938273 RepID=A0A0W8FJ16_9ZZZZ
MDHRARFAVDCLHKQYPEPDRLPEDACLVFVRDRGVCVRKGSTEGSTKGSTPTIFQAAFPDLPGELKRDELTRDARYLGHRGAVACYAVEVPGDLPLPEGLAYSGVRELAGLVPDGELAVAALAVQIVDYDRTTRFCGRCGAATEPVRTERAKICPSCHRIAYPRLSPAIIVLVRKGGSILMVRGGGAAPGRYSLVAGFVEPGETIEDAVRREVREEAGIAIKNIRYCASEPWPFPDSLMLGFVADYDGGDIAPDGVEIESAVWFDRDHLPVLPPQLSLTRALIDDWIAASAASAASAPSSPSGDPAAGGDAAGDGRSSSQSSAQDDRSASRINEGR